MNLFIIYLTILTIMVFSGCGDDTPPNRIHIKNFQIDGSLNEKYIFRKEIEKEKWNENRYKNNDF